MRRTQPSSTIVIVNYRTPELTERAVRGALADGAERVVVVDNASGDESIARLRSIADPRLDLVANLTNPGFGTAANIGARRATTDCIVFLNSDAVPRPGATATLSVAVAAANGRAIVGPRLVSPSGEIQRSAGLVPKPGDLLVRGFELQRIARHVARVPLVGRLVSRSAIASEYDQAIGANEPIEVSMVSGACIAVGRTAFEALGGFDERYFMYFEDADLCRRASAAGWPVRYIPEAVVDHVGGASSSGDYRFGPHHAAAMTRYLSDWHGRSGVIAGLAIVLVRAVGQTLFFRPRAGVARAALRAAVAVTAGRR